jgi:hypothetical protein
MKLVAFFKVKSFAFVKMTHSLLPFFVRTLAIKFPKVGKYIFTAGKSYSGVRRPASLENLEKTGVKIKGKPA